MFSYSISKINLRCKHLPEKARAFLARQGFLSHNLVFPESEPKCGTRKVRVLSFSQNMVFIYVLM